MWILYLYWMKKKMPRMIIIFFLSFLFLVCFFVSTCLTNYPKNILFHRHKKFFFCFYSCAQQFLSLMYFGRNRYTYTFFFPFVKIFFLFVFISYKALSGSLCCFLFVCVCMTINCRWEKGKNKKKKIFSSVSVLFFLFFRIFIV